MIIYRLSGGSIIKAVYCSWCKKLLRGDKNVPYNSIYVSHGMCDECLENMRKQLEKENI